MHRQPLLTLLDCYEESHRDETEMVRRIRELVTEHRECFERTCRPGHVTGSAWILSHDRQRCLLVHHRKLGRWLQPGGHADGQTNVAEVALREAEEETGLTKLHFAQTNGKVVPLDVDVHQIPARVDGKGNEIESAHEHHDIRFLLVATTDQPLVLSDESHDLRWFTKEELHEVTDEESVLRLRRKAGPV